MQPPGNGASGFPEVRGAHRRRPRRDPVSPGQPPYVSWKDCDPCIGPVPALGAHTDRILEGLGYTRERVAALRRDKVI
jgi:crotonobetainyl-CoA:carnitine CoA-transferase CaiB-like acyl-CoA transferase